MSSTPKHPHSRWRRVRLIGLAAGILLVLLLIGGELFARYGLGLGDPPLSITDPTIVYLFKPNQDCWRFGNEVKYNAYSMRSDDFPRHKSDPRELRVMLVGDSVINGGNQTDQRELATELLQGWLVRDLKRPIVVGNISAGSWGPVNELAYVKKYGLFDADLVVIELNSEDVSDVPTFVPLVGVNPNFPDHAPISALWEGVTRYLPRYLSFARFGKQQDPVPQPSTSNEKDIRESMEALTQLIELAQKQGPVMVVQHLKPSELHGHEERGYGIIGRAAREAGAQVLTTGPAFAAAVSRGEHVYRDTIHPNPLGQKVMAKALLKPIEAALGKVMAGEEGSRGGR